MGYYSKTGDKRDDSRGADTSVGDRPDLQWLWKSQHSVRSHQQRRMAMVADFRQATIVARASERYAASQAGLPVVRWLPASDNARHANVYLPKGTK